MPRSTLPAGEAFLVLADDLSGAAEVAAALARPGEPTRIVLGVPATGAAAVDTAGPGLTAVDLDCRAVTPVAAATAVSTALRAAPATTLPFVKLDSLLRGNLAAMVGALTAHAPTVVATALPAAGRTVEGGTVLLDGVPLHRTTAWRIESRPVPRSLPAALSPLPCVVLGTAALRADPVGALAEALAGHRTVVCDAAVDADLDLVAAAALARPEIALAGSGGFAAAVARVTGRPGLPAGPPVPAPGRPVLAVVGSAEPVACRQVAQLRSAGATEVVLRAGETGPAGPLGRGVTVVHPDPEVRGDPGEVVAALARTAAALAAGPDGAHLVLTGGETARRVLDALAITTLEPIGLVAHGAVRSHVPGGRQVVTRPGSFGDTGSLRAMTTALLPTPIDQRKATAP